MPEPESPPAVPYQAYRSKRNSRNFSASRLTPNVSPPPSLSRPTSVLGSPSPPSQLNYGSWEKEDPTAFPFPNGKGLQSPPAPIIILEPSPPASNGFPSPTGSTASFDPLELQADSLNGSLPPSPTVRTRTSSRPAPQNEHPEAREIHNTLAASSSSTPAITVSPVASSSQSTVSAKHLTPVKKASSFRHVPRISRPPLMASPLNPQSHSRTVSTSSMPHPTAASTNPRHSLPPEPHRSSSVISSPVVFPFEARSRMSSFTSAQEQASRSSSYATTQSSSSNTNEGEATPSVKHHPHHPPNQNLSPPPRTTSLQPSPSAPKLHQTISSSSSASTSSVPAPLLRPNTTLRPTTAPYRPGFQPKGVYRPRTDEFIDLRRISRDGDVSSGMHKRVERTKLERRLEKLIALHFPAPGQRQEVTPRPATLNKRASSIFDLDLSDLKNMSIGDAGGLWKGVLSSGSGGKGDIRAAEQRISPWQEDSTVSSCPLCTASFHPLTNRKHHCRLCGQIICSLPVKRPQRPVLCSILFVVDPKTRRIEEVGEGVDYGVRKRRGGSLGGAEYFKNDKAVQEDEAEKFLKGVRICRDCRPVLLRQQYYQEVTVVPKFAKLYDAFTILEKEIEDSLPQFQELLLSLNHDEHPTKEATAARKRLLDAFAQYDALSKQIRRLPCPSGSSQDRVQIAIMTRANLFLQKHMFPLQSLPKPSGQKAKVSSTTPEDNSGLIDPDSEVMLALQPLLEQEALLESFVEEAKAQRKFEDVKTLRTNLAEIRAEIEKILANTETEPGQGDSMKGNGSKGKSGNR